MYFEKVIKSGTEKLSIWDRNVQLAGASIAFYFATFLFEFLRSDTKASTDVYQTLTRRRIKPASFRGGAHYLLLAFLSAGGGYWLL